MDPDQFVALVSEVLDSLPEQFAAALENVEVVVEDWPDVRTRRLAGVRSRYDLLGFYHGIPLTERTSGYNLVAPDKISIYQKSIEAQCETDEEVAELTTTVVLHEVAHFFGIGDERLRELGAY
ncbi:MAG TPA: metallopeptidase family protein [Anaerolineae bacterium]